MSILANNAKLIKVGQEYSAGSGISIDDYVISVTGDVGDKTYSAGENIGIYEQDNQLYISGKDWTNDIEQASANAYEQAIAQIPEPQDLSYISAKVDTNTSGIDYISSVCLTAHQDWTDTIKGASSYSYEQSTSYFDNWVEGQYTGDITNITNKITALSGNFDDYYKKTETSSKDEINDALQYVSANAGKVYEGVSPIVVNNTEDKISADTWTFSAGSNVSFVDDNVNKITRIDCTVTGEGGDPQVNSFVYDNSAKINDVNSSYQNNSGTFLTAIPSQYATTGDVAELAQTISETYYPNTNPSSFVDEDWVTAQGYITGVDLSEYAERAFVLSSIESATSGKLDVSSFASVSSDFLTTSFEISESATWNDTSNVVQTNSAQWGQGGGVISSYTTAWSRDIPPYGGEVIDSLNGKKLSAFVSLSADNANVATNANSATYAQTVDETKLKNDGFVKNLSSEYGTISVVHNNTIESTNSAISRVGNEGFVSSFQNKTIGPTVTANFSWDKSLPNTTFNFTENYAPIDTIVSYSANTNLTGEVTVTSIGGIPFSIEVPNATELNVWSNGWVEIVNNVASAADSFETVVGELAWASALPTYQYDEQDRISAINNSAVAGGTDLEFGYTDADTISSINNSALTDVSLNNIVQTNSGAWGGSALPISAGHGINLSMVDGILVISLA